MVHEQLARFYTGFRRDSHPVECFRSSWHDGRRMNAVTP